MVLAKEEKKVSLEKAVKSKDENVQVKEQVTNNYNGMVNGSLLS